MLRENDTVQSTVQSMQSSKPIDLPVGETTTTRRFTPAEEEQGRQSRRAEDEVAPDLG